MVAQVNLILLLDTKAALIVCMLSKLQSKFQLWHYCIEFIDDNKMQTLREDHYLRVQKQRKQDLYRQMLDEQVRYKNQSKQQKQMPAERYSNNPRLIPNNQYNSHPQLLSNHQLPLIYNQYNPRRVKRNNHSERQRSFDQDDRAQIYLNNCEEIIRNLRDLKAKKKHQHYASPAPHTANSIDVQYYPRPSYFSNGLPYNKIKKADSVQRQIKHRPSKLKTLEVQNKVTCFTPPKQSNNTISSKKNKKRKIVSQEKSSGLQKSDIDRRRQKELSDKQFQSQEPSGIVEEGQLSNKTLQRKAKLIKVLPPSYAKQLYDRSQSHQVRKNEQRAIKNQEEHRRYRQELSHCLNELTKYLKIKNQQSMKNSRLREHQIDQVQNSKAQHSSNSNQQSNQHQSNNNKLNQSKISNLKQTAMQILRKLNKKSQELVDKISQSKKHDDKIYHQPPKTHIKSNDQQQVQQQQQQAQQDKLLQQSKSITLPVVNQHTQTQKVNQLIKIMKDHLNKQQRKDEDFTRCIKQMTQYLKNHQDQKTQYGTQSHVQNFDSNIIHEQKDSHTGDIEHLEIKHKDNSARLQEAVLKRLKKARMRGSIFQEKVQNFRKQHSMHYKKHRIQAVDSPSGDLEAKKVPAEPEQSLNKQPQTHNTNDHFQ